MLAVAQFYKDEDLAEDFGTNVDPREEPQTQHFDPVSVGFSPNHMSRQLCIRKRDRKIARKQLLASAAETTSLFNGQGGLVGDALDADEGAAADRDGVVYRATSFFVSVIPVTLLCSPRYDEKLSHACKPKNDDPAGLQRSNLTDNLTIFVVV